MYIKLITAVLFWVLNSYAGLIEDLPANENLALSLANKVVVYKEVDSKKLNMHLYFPSDLKEGEKRPVMLFIHGGAWRGGNPAVHAFESLYFSKRGIITATISYRLLKNKVTSPEACLSDARDALRYLRKNAGSLNIDPEKILTSGGSAGGHLAAALSTLTDSSWNETDFPNAMILLYPAMDLVNGWKGGANSCKKANIDPKSFSPLHHINAKTPQTLILSGSNDQIVNPKSAREFIKSLKSFGQLSRYIEYQGRGHKLFERDKNNLHFRATLYYMESFLKEIGWLKEVLAPQVEIKTKVFE